jgi:hypothetical protein
MAKGDHIYVNCVASGIPYQHHGIDMGDCTVIHLAPADGSRIALSDKSDRFSVRRDSWDKFCRGAQPIQVNHSCGRTADEIAAAAEAEVGRCGYCLLDGNCEHFARMCACGKSESHQIELGQATVSAVASMTTKAFWAVGSKLSGHLAARGLMKVHPASILADGVELATLAIGCRRGLTSEQTRRLARLNGSIAALGIGAVLGGPAGAALSLAAHSSSTALGDSLCQTIRRTLLRHSTQENCQPSDGKLESA